MFCWYGEMRTTRTDVVVKRVERQLPVHPRIFSIFDFVVCSMYSTAEIVLRTTSTSGAPVVHAARIAFARVLTRRRDTRVALQAASATLHLTSVCVQL